ncbi:Enoyl-CoA hydratase [Colletotrichum gloeosporioides]|uniref:Enoyl-CoA hydratase n=1 Tax=Colletotrichum gloeosporioides TaxID=474922 RepID=A0A8H4FPI8_COLGL|nr:Enoyl-CoA hydratase [Colletotrichum gloeosporioides]KAF3808459.1 Enoyl-CoA hydratase [Colletotrichum gloeosporioides]
MDSLQTLELTVEADKGVALVRFNRPAKRNAFSQVMIGEIIATLVHLDALEAVRAVVITGGPDGPFCANPFYGAAGMDLNELVQISTAEAHNRAFLKDLTDAFARFSKPIIAAVVGFALGGGCEIALACDMIYAAEDASFGLPEIKIGTIPGAGGTQRLARALGKHKAMEFVLTGDSASGAEFERLGVVNKVFPRADVVPAALKLAERIAVMSGPVVKTAKQAVLTVENSHLDAGMTMEKSLYYSTFSLGDFNEGMSAFLQKRRPEFKHQ